jgi:hypothetical protein
MTTVNLELNMIEINNIRNAITVKLIVNEDKKRGYKNFIAASLLPKGEECAMVREDLRQINIALSELRVLENKIDAAVRNQTGEDM